MFPSIFCHPTVGNFDVYPYGTAQGSILGPLIFILYINDLFNYIKHDSSVYMYADYTLL